VVVEVVRRDGRREVIVVGGESEGGSEVDGGSDLATLWFLRILAGVFANVTAGAGIGFILKDTGGTDRGQTHVFGATNLFHGSGCGNRVHAIGLGSSSVPPSRSDYRLLEEFARLDTSYRLDEGVYSIFHSIMYTADVDRVVCEVGFYWRVCDSDGVLRTLLVDRTVFSSCVSLNPGDVIGVTYRFRV